MLITNFNKYSNFFLIEKKLLKKIKYIHRLIIKVLILKYLIMNIKLKTINNFIKFNKVKYFLKQNDLLFLVYNINKNKIYKQFKNLKFRFYVTKIKFLFSLHKYSIKKQLIYSLLKNYFMNIFFFKLTKKILIKTVFIINYLFSIKLNNKFYSLLVFKKLFCFEYIKNKKLVYKFFNNIIKKTIRNNVI